VVHRAPVWLRLGALTALAVALVVLRGPGTAAALLLATVALAVLARLPWRSTLRGLAGVLVTAAALFAYQTWQRGWAVGAEVSADLVTMVLAATVVTATTPTDVLLDLLTRAVRPLRRLGVDPEAFGLAVALMLRTIPALGDLFGEVRDAARARGLERSPRAQLVPFAIRTVARARLTGEALTARGVGD
jgi:biotin transport system permease protein